jgi:hypothetical protein
VVEKYGEHALFYSFGVVWDVVTDRHRSLWGGGGGRGATGAVGSRRLVRELIANGGGGSEKEDKCYQNEEAELSR